MATHKSIGLWYITTTNGEPDGEPKRLNLADLAVTPEDLLERPVPDWALRLPRSVSFTFTGTFAEQPYRSARVDPSL